jgi:pSer/pThr/pTyr-binding forkhead associated (FHA) protein
MSDDDKTLVRSAPALYALRNKQTGQQFEIKPSATVGRQDSCDITLAEGHISRLHASLKVSGTALLLKDEGSENGTFVNGIKINEIVLRPGDNIKFDTHEFMVVSLNDAKTAQTPDSPAAPLAKAADPEATLIQTPATPNPTPPTEENIEDTVIISEPVAPAAAPKPAQTPKPAPEPIAEPAQADATLIMDAPAEIHQAESGTEHIRTPTMGFANDLEQNWDKDGTVIDAPTESSHDQSHFTQEGYIQLYGYHPLVYDQTFPLNKEQLVVGKSPLADIVLKDQSVSSSHAEIYWDGEYWILHDVGSTNGTFLNGQEVFEPVVLMPGDFLQFGLIQVVFGQPEPASYSPGGSKTWLWVGLGAAALLLLGLGTFLIKS